MRTSVPSCSLGAISAGTSTRLSEISETDFALGRLDPRAFENGYRHFAIARTAIWLILGCVCTLRNSHLFEPLQTVCESPAFEVLRKAYGPMSNVYLSIP
jgi:hypothetical protein